MLAASFITENVRGFINFDQVCYIYFFYLIFSIFDPRRSFDAIRETLSQIWNPRDVGYPDNFKRKIRLILHFDPSPKGKLEGKGIFILHLAYLSHG